MRRNFWKYSHIKYKKGKKVKKDPRRIWCYGWVNKRSKILKTLKFHRIHTHDKYFCGTTTYTPSCDARYKEIPQEAIDYGKEVFCKRCFPDIIIYPDMSLPDDLFGI